MPALYVDKDVVAESILGSTPTIGSRVSRLIGPKKPSRVTQLDFEQRIREMSVHDGLAYLYDLNDSGTNWRYILSKYYRWVTLQSAEDIGETYYRALALFIQKVITKKVAPNIFLPPSDERERFYLADYYARRDPILHLETIFNLGRKILIHPTALSREKLIGEHLAESIATTFKRQITRENILNIWSVAARFHDVGRVEPHFTPPRMLTDETNICRYMNDAIQTVRNDEARRDYNHGRFTAAYLYYRFWKDIKGSALEMEFAIALDAISRHDDYVRRILSGESISIEDWNHDAMAIFLALMLILGELSVRIVWSIGTGSPSLADWSVWQRVRTSIPVPRVEVNPRENGNFIAFHVDPQISHTMFSTYPPILPSILTCVGKIFGPQFLALTESDLAFTARWVGPDILRFPKWYTEYTTCIEAMYDWMSKKQDIWGKENWYINLRLTISKAWPPSSIAQASKLLITESDLLVIHQFCRSSADSILKLIPGYARTCSLACEKLAAWLERHQQFEL